MRKVVKTLLTFSLVAAVAVACFADEPKQEPKKKRQRQQTPAAVTALKKSLAKVELNEDQQSKIKEIMAAKTKELRESAAKRRELIGRGKQREMTAARKKANEAGKKGEELWKAIQEEMGWSDEQLAKIREVQTATTKLTQQMRAEVVKVLTPEQREKAGIKVRRIRKRLQAKDKDK